MLSLVELDKQEDDVVSNAIDSRDPRSAVSTELRSVDDGNRSLGAGEHYRLRNFNLFGRQYSIALDEPMSFIVVFEEVWRRHVATSMTGTHGAVDYEFHVGSATSNVASAHRSRLHVTVELVANVAAATIDDELKSPSPMEAHHFPHVVMYNYRDFCRTEATSSRRTK